MSQDAGRAPEIGGPQYARCKAQPRDIYTRLYIGTQRPPQSADEKGAICVIDAVFGGRVVIFPIAGDSDHRRVELLRGST